MTSNHKAFTLMEALISLSLIAFMLALYLPGINQACQKLIQAQTTTQAWQLAAEIADVAYGSLPDAQKTPHLEQIVQNYSQLYHIPPPSYEISATSLKVLFVDQLLEVTLNE